MNIEILGVKEKGNKNKERIVFKALSDLDIGYYMVFFTEKLEENAFNGNAKHVFWLPNKEIKKGDLVVLYTKHGKESEKTNLNGDTSYFYYVGLENPFFNNSIKVPALIEVKAWITTD